MEKSLPTYHFISGLPRSGSTLLSALLLQNPRFHAGISSPVGPLFEEIRHMFSAGSEFGPVVTQAQRRRLVRGIFDAYYADQADLLPENGVIFDTSRMWCAQMPMLADQFPGAKVIACVRNVAWVMDSLERRYRADPYEMTRMFNNDNERNTVFSRTEALWQRNRLVGFSWEALKEAYYGEHAASLLLVEYELLAAAPHKVLPLIYAFINEAPFEHDYDNVQYDAPAFDAQLGMGGLHTVRPKVAFEPRRTVLPPDLFEQFASRSFWQNREGSAANVITVKAGPEAVPESAPGSAPESVPKGKAA